MKTEDDTKAARQEQAANIVNAIVQAAVAHGDSNLISVPAKDRATGREVTVLAVIRPAPQGGVFIAPIARIIDHETMREELEFEDGLLTDAPSITSEELDAQQRASVDTHEAPATVQ